MSMRIFLVALGLAVALTRGATACSCGWVHEPGTPLLSDGSPVPTPDELAEQPFLFLGTVESVRVIPTGDPDMDLLHAAGADITFRVELAWRGTYTSSTVTIHTGSVGGGCGYSFGLGRCYLVFASRDDQGVPGTDICTRTTSIDRAIDLLPYVYAFLGAPRVPGAQRLK